MKYSWKFKLDTSTSIKTSNTSHIIELESNTIILWIRLEHGHKNYDDLGVARLQHSAINKDLTHKSRFELVAKVLAGNFISSASKIAHVNAAKVY